jgi:integrase/recombinase XerD
MHKNTHFGFTESDKLLSQLEQDLKIKNYSPKTVKSYIYALRQYFLFKQRDLKTLDKNNLKQFFASLEQKQTSPQTRNMFLGAIKYFYQHIVGSHQEIKIPYAKTSLSLPVVLSRQEVQSILSVTKNQKHKLMLALAYGAGLRVSEVVTLKVKDLDLTEMTIHLKNAKGQKDRISVFPEKLIEPMKKFIAHKSGNEFVFSSNRGGKLTTRTAQKIFSNSLKKTHIKKEATFHSLRHSFATHLLENGVNVRYVQALLGHYSIRTTQLYTQVTNPKLKSIRSPL